MIVKLIVFAVIALMLYKWLGGTVAIPKPKTKPKAGNKPSAKDAEMVECDKCGVYVSIEETTLISGKYVCEECMRKEKKS